MLAELRDEPGVQELRADRRIRVVPAREDAGRSSRPDLEEVGSPERARTELARVVHPQLLRAHDRVLVLNLTVVPVRMVTAHDFDRERRNSMAREPKLQAI